MDTVSIVLIILAGALAVFLLLPANKPAPAPVKQKTKPAAVRVKKKTKKTKKKAQSPSPAAAPAPAPAPEPEPEPEPEVAPAPAKPTKKQRQKAAAKARKKKEAEEKAAAEKAAKKAAKKKARKAKKTVSNPSAPSADVAEAPASTSEQFTSASSFLDDDEDAGEWESVSAVKKRKKQVVKKAETKNSGGPTVVKKVDIGDQIRALIGRGGSVINSIREATGVDINTPRRDEDSTIVTVSGNADGVTLALQLIDDRISGRNNSDDRDSTTITIEADEVRYVVGRGGATIKAIQAQSGASLDISREGTPTIVIRGDQDQIAAAQALTEKAITNRGVLDGVRETLQIGDGHRRIIIGPKGVTVNGIRDKTGAQLNVNDGEVEIFGTPVQVKAAAAAISAILADYITITMTVEDRQCGTIIGSKGATITKLQSESGASINVNNGEVSISGNKAAVARAQAAIQAVLDAPPSFSPLPDGVNSKEMDVEGCVSRVIGRKGATMQKIQKDTGAKLDFLDQLCRIAGTDEQIEEAEKAVQAILDAEAKRAEQAAKREAEREAQAAALAEAAENEDEEDALDADDEILAAAEW